MRIFLSKHLQGKKVLILSLLTNAVFAFMLFYTIPKTMIFSSGMKLLDMMPMGYDIDYVVKLFDTLGEEGRASYLYNQLPVDLFYPGLFAISYCLLIAFFINKIGKYDSPIFYLCLLPIIAGLEDYFENLGIIKMLLEYPNIDDFTAAMTNVFTVIKSISTTVYFIALIAILGIFTFKKFQKSIT